MTHVQYKNTFADVLWFSLYTYMHSPVLLLLYSALAGLIGFSSYTSVPASASFAARVFTMLFMFAFIFSLVFGAIALFVVASLISKANRTILTQHTISVAETGLTEETEFNRTEQKWAGIPRLVRTRRHIFAYVSQYAAHVIPRRAFEDTAAWDAFYCELQSNVQRNV